MSQLNFTSSNPALVKVALFSSKDNWVNLMVKHLPDAEQAETLAIFEQINSEVFANIEDTQELKVSALRYKDGAYQKAYPLSVHSFESQLAIKFNDKVAVITPEAIDNLMGDFKEAQVENYNQPCLVLTHEISEDELVILNLPLRLNEEAFNLNREDREMFVKKLAMAAKKGKFDKIASFLVETKEGSDGGGDGTPVVKLETLPELEEIKILSYKAVDLGERTAYVMTLLNPEGEKVNCWAPGSLKQMFEAGAIITDDSSIIYRSKKRGTKTINDAKLLNYEVPEEESNLMSLFV